MTIKVLAFGAASDLVGGKEVLIELPEPCTTDHLQVLLVEKFPKLKSITSFSLSVNHSFIDESLEIGTDDEIAIIPPVSGG